MQEINPPRFEKYILGQRAIVEYAIEQLKEVCQIEHTRHQKIEHFMINVIAALTAYTLKPYKNLRFFMFKKVKLSFIFKSL